MALALSPLVSLYPVGTPAPPSAGPRLALAYDPEHEAFGDGSHPTTRLCAGAVDLVCRIDKPESVLDVGTGTGVLARIARARGASFIAATDIDPIALESSRLHALMDENSAPIHVRQEAPDHWGPRFDLVIANILEDPLRFLAPRLRAALRPSGRLLISGFTPLQAHGLRLAFEATGLRFESESQLEGWVLLAFRL